MSNNDPQRLLYAVDQEPPRLMAFLLGFQICILIIGGITLTPIIALTGAGLTEQFGTWVIFAALLISGLLTILQAAPVGRFGAGHILFMGTSGAFTAVSIAALKAGGLPLLATLVIMSSLVQFAFARHLSVFRKIINPTVGGTVITLIAVTIMPVGFNMLSQVPAGYDGGAAGLVITTIVALVAIIGISLFASGSLRLWGPFLGLVIGCLVAAFFGMFSFSSVLQADWVGIPRSGWPGLDLAFEASFWLLLPGFLIVTIVGALETYGDGIAIQHISSNTRIPTDFRVVQGAVNADGLGNLASGLMGTLPNTTYSTSISVVEMTGVASRRVGIYGGLVLAALAFCPKLAALLLAVPAPVLGVFTIMMLILLFGHGLRMVCQDGLSFDNAIVFGVSFWAGSGFQNLQIFSAAMPGWLHQLLDNGMTAGGIVAVILSAALTLKTTRAEKRRMPLDAAAMGSVQETVTAQGLLNGWRGDDLGRLQLAAEEAMALVLEQAGAKANRILEIQTRFRGDRATIELIAAGDGENIESLLQRLPELPEQVDDELHLRILRHMTDRVEHQQFSNAAFLLIEVVRQQDAMETFG